MDNKLPSIINSPPKLYLYCFLLFVAFCFAIPFLSKGAPGGEQKPITLLALAINYLCYSYFILSIITSIIYISWFKKYWFVNLLIFLFIGYLMIVTYN